VKHRSPLVTLAAVAVAFVIMFTVNMLSGPPGGSSTGTVGPSAAPVTADATSPSSQPSVTAVTTPPASASESVEDSKFPEVNEAKKPAGLYQARGSKTTVGWIVLEDGSVVGIQTTGTESSAAPQPDPADPEVTLNGEKLDAAPVDGDEDL
jgi:hypothetical protein